MMLKAIIVTSFAKWFAVVAFIWVEEVYVQLLLLLALPAQFKCYQGNQSDQSGGSAIN